MQLKHMNEYRTKLGLAGGLTFDIKRAEGCYVWDADGNKRLDFIGCVGVYLLGHNNPFIVENVHKYLATKPLTMDPLALKPITAAFAHNMALVTPGLTRTIVNGGGGAEAVEAVLKLVRIAAGRNHPERKRIVSTLNSFHGKTLGAVSAGGKDVWRRWQPVISDHTYVRRTATSRPSRRSSRRATSSRSSPRRSKAKAASSCLRTTTSRRSAACATSTAST